MIASFIAFKVERIKLMQLEEKKKLRRKLKLTQPKYLFFRIGGVS